MATEKLIVSLESDTAKLRADLDKVDDKLNKLDGSTKKADSGLDDFGSTAMKVGGVVFKLATAAIAVKTAVDAMVLSSAQARRENEVLAKVAKTSVDNFLALSFALKQFNVDAKGTADAMNDVSERLGEFSVAASGPFQDFADVMGLTKEEAINTARALEKMSAEDAIRKMVSDMEAANIAGPRMSFVLKSMSNDLEYASGAFADNSAELVKLKKLYTETAGQIKITNEQAGELKQAATSFDLMTGSIGAATTAISATLAPALNEFFNTVIEIVPDATQKIIDFINSFQDAENITSMKDMVTQIENMQARAAELEQFRGVSDIFGNPADIAKKLELQGVEERLNELYFARLELQKKIEANALGDADRSGGGTIGGGGGNGIPGGGNGADKNDELDALKDRFKSEEELLTAKYEKEQKLARGNKDLLAELENEYIERLMVMDEESAIARQEADRDRYFENFENLGQEKFDAEIAEQQRLLEAKLINEEDYLKSVYSLGVKYGKLDQKSVDKTNKDKDSSNSDYYSAASTLADAAFEDNKAVRAGMVVVDAASGIVKAFADLPYPAAIAASASIAAIGVAQLASISSASSGGGSVSAPSGTSAPAENTSRFSSSVEVNESVAGGGSTSNNIHFTADSSDGLGSAMVKWLNEELSAGSVKLGG